MTPVEFGPFRLDPARRLLLRDGQSVALTPKAFDALALLVERRDRVVSKRELLAALWPDTAVEEATLSQHVFLVRRALGDSGNGEPLYVATVARRGYRFVAPVTPIETIDAADVPIWRHAPWRVLAVVAVGAAIGIVAGWNANRTAPPPRVFRLAVPAPDGQRLWRRFRGGPTLSRDGRSIVYAADGRLYLRRLDADVSEAIAGTDMDASAPFFSDDGAWIGFWSARDSTLKKIGIHGGSPLLLGPAINPHGASWFGDRVLVGEGDAGIVALPESGGSPIVWVAPRRDEMLLNPQALPGGDAVLFTAATVSGNDIVSSDVVGYSRAASRRQIVIPNATAARYVPTGRIVYAVGGEIFSAPFDILRLKITGEPVAIASDPGGAPQFDAAADGTLIYVGGGNARPLRSLVLVDARAGQRALLAEMSSYHMPRVSPNGRRLAFVSEDGGGTIWLCDLADVPRPRRLTFDGGERSPIWSPDGRRIAYGSTRSRQAGIFVRASDGSGTEQRLTTAERGFEHQPGSWSPDGRTIAFTNVKLGVKDTIWRVSIDGTRAAELVAAVPGSNQMDPAISPDARWLAYAADDTADGAPHIFVRPWPLGGVRLQVSRQGSDMPVWSRDGSRLFYRAQSAWTH